MQAVILAAGAGTRLKPLTDDTSKAMVQVLGRPLIEHLLFDLIMHGRVREFFVVLHPDQEDMISYCQNPPTSVEKLTVVFQKQRLGMAHALSSVRDYLRGMFWLAACDSLYPHEHYLAMLQEMRDSDSDGVLTLEKVTPDVAAHKSNVKLRRGYVDKIIEKPMAHEIVGPYSAAPLYLLDQRICPYLLKGDKSKRGEWEMPPALQQWIEDGAVVSGVETPKRWDITTPEDLLKANLDWFDVARDRISTPLPVEGCTFREPVIIDPLAEVGPGCVIGPRVYISRGCKIGPNTTLVNTLLLEDTVIEGNCYIAEQLISPHGVVVA